MLLEIDAITVRLGAKAVLHELSLGVERGTILALIGPPGCGKSTVLHATFGLVATSSGRIRFDDCDVTNHTPQANIDAGIVLVPQGGRVFRTLTVRDNLRLGGHTLADERVVEDRTAAVFGLFPRLAERQRQVAGSLSGGERQMLALGIALMLRPRVLLLDEPSTGLSPILTERALDQVRRIATELGSAVLVVEQNVKNAMYVGHRVAVIRRGRIVLVRASGEHDTAPALLEAYAFS
jgi:branched-chain amino acid transport system ATP-binding protein